MNHTLRAATALAAVLVVGPVRAELAPRAGGFDARVQLVAYNPLNVVRVVGSPTHSTQVIFAPREEITQVAIGDADAWLAQPTGNLLFIKPTEVRHATNMQVVTRRPDGSKRSYQFRLVAARRGAAGESPAVFALNFTYPEDERAAQAAFAAQQAAVAAEKAATARLAQAWAQGPRNWRYVAQGSTLIEPAEVSDNGRQTALRFPGSMRVPTIYAAAPDGSETIVAYTMDGDTAVVQTTARVFTLRDGQEVLRIANRGFDPVGRDPGTGTGTPDLSRTVRSSGL
jgi:type IV secretion system protein VirB9